MLPPMQAANPTTTIDPSALAVRLKIALRAAETAGAILMGHFGSLRSIDEKSPIDFVTAADRDSEAQVLGELRSAFPSDVILAEEQDGKDGATALREQFATLPWCWVVDPLDGTTNFAHGNLQFAVSIGLAAYGLPVLGVVLAPARREIFVGGVGIRATANGRPIVVSHADSIARALIATGFPYDRREHIAELTERIGRVLMTSHGLRRAGAASLDLCELAAGRLDGFYEQRLAPWDVCAGHAVVEAAGGRLSDFAGGRHDVFGGETIASNGRLHGALVELVRG